MATTWSIYFAFAVIVGAGVALVLRRFAYWTPGWATAAAVFTVLTLSPSTWLPALVQGHELLASACAAGLIGVFFAFALRLQGWSLRTAIIAGIVAALIVGVLTLPIETHAVKLDMPRPR